jgi:hypothetical protein
LPLFVLPSSVIVLPVLEKCRNLHSTRRSPYAYHASVRTHRNGDCVNLVMMSVVTSTGMHISVTCLQLVGRSQSRLNNSCEERRTAALCVSSRCFICVIFAMVALAAVSCTFFSASRRREATVLSALMYLRFLANAISFSSVSLISAVRRSASCFSSTCRCNLDSQSQTTN